MAASPPLGRMADRLGGNGLSMSSQQRGSTDKRPVNVGLYAGAAGLLAVIAIVAGVTLGAEYALPIVILAVLLLGFFAINDHWARRNLDRHGGDPIAAQADESEALPTAHVIPDETALGDTEEAHSEISPLDLPRDAPGRKAAEEQAAAGSEETTRGHREGAAKGPQLNHDDAPPSRD
jgi:hypothetical protein